MQRKAILLTIRSDNEELKELAYSQGCEVAAVVHQRRPQPDPQYHLGTGKLEEAREALRLTGSTLVLVNAALKPNQIFNLQQVFAGRAGDGGRGDVSRGDGRGSDGRSDGRGSDGRGTEGRGSSGQGNDDGEDVEVWDRTRLILEIFRERAGSPEARLQVELAQLTYEMPLVKEAINQEKKGERQAGMFGGGEYEVSQYHDMMKKRMTRIKRELEKMRLERGLRRKHRRRSGYHLVSLAGYTNAGKSSLLKAVAPAPTLIENRYFSTLSTKTRRAESDKREILVTDTVGFIEDLPPWMVDAFHSTLEEIAFSDVTLLVVDASDPLDELMRRLKSSLRILWQFDAAPLTGRGLHRGGARSDAGAPAGDAGYVSRRGSDGGSSPGSGARFEDAWDAPRHLVSDSQGLAPILVVFNKIDRLAPGELEEKAERLVEEGLVAPEGYVGVSALTGDGVQDLYNRIYELLPDYDLYEVALPQTPATEAFVAWLHAETDVIGLTRGNEVHVRFEAKGSLRLRLERQLQELGATPLQVPEELPDGLESEAAETESQDAGSEEMESPELDSNEGAPAGSAPSGPSKGASGEGASGEGASGEGASGETVSGNTSGSASGSLAASPEEDAQRDDEERDAGLGRRGIGRHA